MMARPNVAVAAGGARLHVEDEVGQGYGDGGVVGEGEVDGGGGGAQVALGQVVALRVGHGREVREDGEGEGFMEAGERGAGIEHHVGVVWRERVELGLAASRCVANAGHGGCEAARGGYVSFIGMQIAS